MPDPVIIMHAGTPGTKPDSETIIADLCEHVGMAFDQYLGEREVLRLCDRLGYQCDESTLEEFDSKNYAKRMSGIWSAMATHKLIAALESRRRWKPAPNPMHDCKKSGPRLELERRQAAGNPNPFDDLDKHSVEDLLLMMAGCDDRQTRECIYEATRCKIRGEGLDA